MKQPIQNVRSTEIRSVYESNVKINFIYLQTRNFVFKIFQVFQIFHHQEYISCPLHWLLSHFETVFLGQKKENQDHCRVVNYMKAEAFMKNTNTVTEWQRIYSPWQKTNLLMPLRERVAACLRVLRGTLNLSIMRRFI
jgi:hypothetical protein